ncbi:MAG: hypothetical protein H0W07_03705, partial [Chloroflexi bacterium]|nr:hypothetical protein [Chloroflexota bacterium]
MALVLVATLLGVSGTPGIARGAVANLGPTRLIVDPPCAPPPSPLAAAAIPTRFGISGRDFGPNQQLRLQFEPGGDNQPVDLGTVTAGPYGSFDTAADLVLPTAPGSYIIRAVDTANGDYQVVEPVQLPCLPSVVVTPRCGPADDGSGTVVTDIGVDGRAWAPDLPVTVTFLGPTFDGYVPLGDPVQTDPDQNGGFNVRLRRPGLPPAVYAVRVDQPRIKTTIDLEFRVPCLTPTL